MWKSCSKGIPIPFVTDTLNLVKSSRLIFMTIRILLRPSVIIIYFSPDTSLLHLLSMHLVKVTLSGNSSGKANTFRVRTTVS